MDNLENLQKNLDNLEKKQENSLAMAMVNRQFKSNTHSIIALTLVILGLISVIAYQSYNHKKALDNLFNNIESFTTTTTTTTDITQDTGTGGGSNTINGGD